jgi:hypothetical protein
VPSPYHLMYTKDMQHHASRTLRIFLATYGIAMLVIALLGYVGLLGPTSARSIFHQFWWYTQDMSLAYGIIGLIALVGAYFFSYFFQLILVLLVSLPGLAAGLLFISQVSLAAQANTSAGDALLHLAQGVGVLLVLDELFLRKRKE